MIFVLVFLALLLISFFNFSLGNNKFFKILGFFVILFLITLCTIRNESGADFGSYKVIFETLSQEYYLTIMEPLFSSWVYIVGKISSNFNFFLFTIAAVSLFLKFNFIRKYSPYVIFSILIYITSNFITQDMGQIRQGVAIGFTLTALDFYFRKKYTYFYLLIAFTTLIHYTAIVFLLIPLISKINLKTTTRVVTWFVAFGIGLSLKSFAGLILQLEGLISDPYLATKLSYVTDDNFNQQASFGLGMLFRLLLMVFFANTLSKQKNILSKNDYNRNLIFLNIYYFGGFVYFILSFIEIYAGRISIYFTVVEIVLLPIYLKMSRDFLIKALILIFYLIFASTLLYSAVFLSKDNYLEPFKTIL